MANPHLTERDLRELALSIAAHQKGLCPVPGDSDDPVEAAAMVYVAHLRAGGDPGLLREVTNSGRLLTAAQAVEVAKRYEAFLAIDAPDGMVVEPVSASDLTLIHNIPDNMPVALADDLLPDADRLCRAGLLAKFYCRTKGGTAAVVAHNLYRRA